mgnify:CR=1 FL=1
MLFTSYGFIAFLAVLFALYYLIPRKWQWLLLLAADIVFYACAGWQGLVFMAATVTVSWAATNLMGASLRRQKAFLASDEGKALSRPERKEYKKLEEKKRKRVFVLALLIDLGILAALKYTNFVIFNFNSLFSAQLAAVDWVLPLGISFYTFQTVSYVIDVYWEKVEPERNILKVALFTSFFPLLIQGPISRFGDLKDTLFAEHKADFKQISFGLQRILWGYFKKLVIADRLLVAVTALCGDPTAYSGAYVFLGAVFYAAELYADFTGGIDITIGIAQVLGVSVKENFIRPYFSRNIAEYWRRWHISMGTWFKDYIFYPLSVAPWLLKLSKKARKSISDGFGKKLSVYVSTIVTWFLTGLWHGAAWNFVVWGLYMAFFLILEKLFLLPLLKKSRVLGHVYTMFLVIISFVIFSAADMADAGNVIAEMFGAGGLTAVSGESLYYLRSYAATLLIAVLGSLPVVRNLFASLEAKMQENRAVNVICTVGEPLVLAALLILVTGYLVDGSFNPFLYFRF